MHRVRKAIWALRALLRRPTFGSLGMPSYLGPPTFLLGTRRMHIGRRVRIFPGLRAECHGAGTIRIDDDVAIEQDVHITAMGELSIGKGTAVLARAVITDIDHEYEDVSLAVLRQPMRHLATRVGANCFIGTGAVVLAGTVLGDGCIVGANAVVRGEFEPHSVIVGIPARVVRRYDPESGTWGRVE